MRKPPNYANPWTLFAASYRHLRLWTGPVRYRAQFLRLGARTSANGSFSPIQTGSDDFVHVVARLDGGIVLFHHLHLFHRNTDHLCQETAAFIR